MKLSVAKNDIKNRRPISITLSSLNRFWFYPGENRYQETGGVVLIEASPVVLLTENKFINHRGQVVRSGYGDPLAAKFAQSFTKHYVKIATERPIYAQLEGLFRSVVLAKIIGLKKPQREVRLGRKYFRSGLQVPKTLVRRQL